MIGMHVQHVTDAMPRVDTRLHGLLAPLDRPRAEGSVLAG